MTLEGLPEREGLSEFLKDLGVSRDARPEDADGSACDRETVGRGTIDYGEAD